MKNRHRSRQALKKDIVAAFAGVRRPRDDEFLDPACCEDLALAKFVQSARYENWRDIPSEVLEYFYDILPLLSPKAFAFCLPAYVVFSIENFASPSNVVEFTLYALSPPEAACGPTDRRFWLSKLDLFTQRQKEVIRDHLMLVRDDGDAIARQVASEALERYWNRFVLD